MSYMMFIAIFLIQILISVEMGTIGPLSPFFAKYFSIPENTVIFLSLGYSAVGILVPYLGVFADRNGKKKSIIIGLISFFIGSIMAGFSQEAYLFAISRVFIGLGYFSLSASLVSYLSEFISYENRGKASGIPRTAFGLSMFVTPLVASNLVNKYNSLGAIYFPLAIVSVVALFLMLKLPETKKDKNVKIDISEILSLFKDPVAKKILLTVFLFLSAPSLILNFMSIYISNEFNLSQVTVGLIYTVMALGSIIGIVLSGLFADKIGKYKFSKRLFLILPLSLLPILLFNNLIIIATLVTIFSFALDGSWTAYQALASEVIPEKRGTFMSMFYTINALTITFYSIIGPTIYTIGGFKLMILLASTLLSIGIYIVYNLKLKD